MDIRAELSRRVAAALDDLRHEMINGGVDAGLLLPKAIITETMEGVNVAFFETTRLRFNGEWEEVSPVHKEGDTGVVRGGDLLGELKRGLEGTAKKAK